MFNIKYFMKLYSIKIQKMFISNTQQMNYYCNSKIFNSNEQFYKFYIFFTIE